MVEQVHVKANRCPGLLDYPLDQSMTNLMAKEFGIIEHRTQINMRSTALPDIPAKALGVAAGTPSLYLSRAILDEFDEVIELDQEFWRHDAIDIRVEQGYEISRPSQIYLKTESNGDDIIVNVGGKVIKVAEGTLY